MATHLAILSTRRGFLLNGAPPFLPFHLVPFHLVWRVHPIVFDTNVGTPFEWGSACVPLHRFLPSTSYTLSCQPILSVGLNGPHFSNAPHPILPCQTPLKDYTKNTCTWRQLKPHTHDSNLVQWSWSKCCWYNRGLVNWRIRQTSFFIRGLLETKSFKAVHWWVLANCNTILHSWSLPKMICRDIPDRWYSRYIWASTALCSSPRVNMVDNEGHSDKVHTFILSDKNSKRRHDLHWIAYNLILSYTTLF